MKTIKYRRTSEIKISNEARLLRKIRLDRGISIREASRRLCKSESYLRHVENGRLDVPKKEELKKILSIYQVSFRQFKLRNKSEVELDPYIELKKVIQEIPISKQPLALSILKNLIE